MDVAQESAFGRLVAGLTVPMIAAPMTGVSSLELVDAATRAGVVGSFPVHNCRSTAQVDAWLSALRDRPTVGPVGPVVPNVIVHRTNQRREADLEVVVRHRVPAVITSVGSPADVVPTLHDAGIQVWSDVASMKHVYRAIDAGVDALVLLTAGAGGQTGWANPFPFVRAVRKEWDGPVILAGGICDGTSLLAARVAGCDLGYVGTPFIATHESAASQAYRAAVTAATLDDVELTSALTGVPTSMIRKEGVREAAVSTAYDATVITGGAAHAGESDTFIAGHTVVGVEEVLPAAALVARFREQYVEASRRTAALVG